MSTWNAPRARCRAARPSPIPVGSRLRLSLTIVEAVPHARGTRLTSEASMEMEGADKPAIVARHIMLIENP